MWRATSFERFLRERTASADREMPELCRVAPSDLRPVSVETKQEPFRNDVDRFVELSVTVDGVTLFTSVPEFVPPCTGACHRA